MPRKSWWARLPFALRMTAGTSVLLVLIAAGAAGIAAITKDKARVGNAVGRDSATMTSAAPGAPAEVVAEPPATDKGLGDATAVGRGGRISNEADRTATRAPRTTDSAEKPGSGVHAGMPKPPVPGAAPVVTTQTVSETRDIPFKTRLVRDPSLPRGQKRVQTEGIPGVETLRYLITYADGEQTDRRLVDSTVTRQPQHRVIAFGSRGWHDSRGWRDPQGWRGRPSECGPELAPCLPLGRRSACPDQGPAEASGVQLGGSVTVLDEDLALLDPDDLDGLELDPGLVC